MSPQWLRKYAGNVAVRVMIDTNVLLSAMLFPGGRMNELMRKAAVGNYLTGDKNFEDLNLDKPEILTPAQFLAR